jgi:hypothetical protein
VIPKSDNCETLGLQIYGSGFVLFQLKSMLSTIDFNHNFPVNADKITNIRPDAMLPAKFITAKCPIPQKLPQTVFGIGLVFSQLPGDVSSFRVRIHFSLF